MNLKVLVVDDSSTMRRIIVNVLKQLDIHDIMEAKEGKTGYELYEKEKFNLILTDWNMPIMNGLEFVNKIRSKDKDTPIIMITTESGKTEVITALKAGVNNFITKPFTPKILKEKLDKIVHI